MLNILFLCTGNSCRSIMAEGLLNNCGKDRFKAFSAGSNPTGKVHPISLKTLQSKNISTDYLYSKSWNELVGLHIDIVITICDNAAGEACPVFLNKAIKAHWGVPDPEYFKGTDIEIEVEFNRVCEILERRIKSLYDLNIESLDKDGLQQNLNKIGNIT